jgi:hypothetical protein
MARALTEPFIPLEARNLHFTRYPSFARSHPRPVSPKLIQVGTNPTTLHTLGELCQTEERANQLPVKLEAIDRAIPILDPAVSATERPAEMAAAINI